MKLRERRILTVILGLTLFLLPACAPAPAPNQSVFATPDEAAKALMKGLKTNDARELKAVFGPDVESDLSSGDPVLDRLDREAIAIAMEQSWKWAQAGSDRMELIVGDEEWPLPAPLAKVRGGWQFDTAAGADELLSRRIGRNELRVIDLCRDYVTLQKQYASQPRDGKVAGFYAQQLLSTPDRQDGLYWKVGPQEPPSPLDALVAQAVVDGYAIASAGEASGPFWGYHFRVLTAQGAAAKGGAKSYIVDGEMSAGFALVAYPADYGHGGIMTFIVSQDGVVYEKDLGGDTATIAARLTAYDPDSTWAAVKGPRP